MSLLQKDQPLYLPKGSIRGILALFVTGAYIVGAFTELELVTLVLGFYFGERSSAVS